MKDQERAMTGVNPACKGCAYYAEKSAIKTCDYLLITGRRRPCPAGEGCTVKEGSDQMPRERKWDAQRARELYDEGLDDESIADMVGATASAVQGWRGQNRLPKHRRAGERFTLMEEGEALSVTADAVPPPMGPPAQTSEAFALGRGEAAQRMSPRTYAGANDTKLASTKGEASDYETDAVTAPPEGETRERKPSQTPPVAAPAPPEGEPRETAAEEQELEETPERIGGDDMAKLYIDMGLIAGVALSVPQELRRALKNVEMDLLDLAHKLQGEVWRC